MLLNNRQLVSLLHPVGDSHEIIDKFALEDNLKAHLVQAPGINRDVSNWIRLPRVQSK